MAWRVRKAVEHGFRSAIARAAVGAAPVAAATAGLVLGACLDVGAFACERDDQCALDGRGGQCSPEGYCAFADPACESGLRYHGSAAADLAGDCVPAIPGASGPEPPGPTSDTEVTHTSATGGATSATGEGSGSLGLDPSTSTGHLDCGDHPCPCAVAIAAGDSSTCAVREDGSLVCWGENDDDQLGVVGKNDTSPWPLVATFPAGTKIASIVAGNDHYCAVAQAGDAYCWGRNVEGMALPMTAPEDVAPPAPLDWLEGIGALSLGPQLTCGADAAGIGATCWGSGELGELGDLMELGPGPHPIGPPLDALPVDELAAGRDHVCARSMGDVLCWGSNQNGQLGTGAPVDPDPVPAPVMLPAPAVRLTAGRRHTCAVLAPGDDIVCWGRNDLGQIGADTTNFKHTTPLPIAAELDGLVVDLRASLDGTCALTDAGSLWCWGSNNSDKLGLGADVELTAVPVVLDVTAELPEPAIEVAVGDRHICLRTGTGRVFCWGDDSWEQLGAFDPQPGMRSVEIDLECDR